jgi:LPS-assembly protein
MGARLRPASWSTVLRAALAVLLLACLPGAAVAQKGLASALTQRAMSEPASNMVVRAREMVYDNDHNTVTAIGEVQIYYGGRVLQADRVVYDRATSRVRAYGNVKITEADGTLSYADSFELSDDFREGFINSLRIETTDKTRFAAARAERIQGNFTVFENGVYTACQPCKDNPQKPPLWQVKAARIIHNDQEKMIYFEDARLEFFGVPLAYVPYLSSPDPTVKRKSGVLTPTFIASSELGVGVEVPYFFALAPNYDLTLEPGFTTRQGPMLKAEWRHRTMTGSYLIRGFGVFQLDPEAFPNQGDQTFRGTVESNGDFWLNEKWHWGWDVTGVTDRFVRDDYNIDRTTRYDLPSYIYLTGEGTKSWFDARSIYFLGLTQNDVQAELPIIHPVIDYDYIVDQPVLGGELGWNVNLTSLSRREAAFDKIRNFADPFITCNGQSFLSTPRSSCLQRGIDGSYTRLSADLYWKRTLTDRLGQQWTPFAYLRGDLAWTDLDTDSTPVQFVDANQAFLARGIPAIGLEYHYPFLATTDWGSQVIEPIAQIIMRPRLQQSGHLPNEDAQSLVYDDTNLFEWNKFSGYDRIEDGSRFNAGLQYTLTTNGGAYYNAMIGQSYALFGVNPYEQPDMTNLALESGLDTTTADYIARLTAQPFENIALSSRMRFDQNDFALKRLELDAVGTIGRVTTSIIYGRFAAQPLLGLEEREGVLNRTSLKLSQYWSASGGALYDIDQHKFSSAFAGMSYLDECFGMGLNVTREFTSAGNEDAVTKVMFQLSLRTLGDVDLSQKFGPNMGFTQ